MCDSSINVHDNDLPRRNVKYILLDVLSCSITEYFYELFVF